MKVYQSKIDIWFWIIILMIYLFGIFLAIDNIWNWIIIIICIILTACCLFIKYVIKEDKLLIKIAFFSQTIDIKSIRKIEKTNSILSSPASSFDRIEIFYNKYDSIILSPKNKKGFIADLLAINPTILVKL